MSKRFGAQGRSTIRALSHPAVQWFSEQCVVAALVLLVPLYLLDFSYWSSPIGVGVRRAAYAFTALAFVATVFADGACSLAHARSALSARSTSPTPHPPTPSTYSSPA